MANFKNSNYSVVTGAQTLPLQVAGTGTISTVGKAVKGVGTLFTTEMPLGSWLVDLSQNEIRRITAVTSDTLAYFENPFTVDIAALTVPDYIHVSDCNNVAISVKAVGGAILIDGVSLPEGESMTFSKDSRTNSSRRDLVDPIVIDANGNSVLALIMK